jgi:5-methylcytosine-specific restriction enzyme subunit McrC
MLEILELREGLSIRASSYVGRITLGDVQLTIRPKIRGLPFLQLLRYA